LTYVFDGSQCCVTRRNIMPTLSSVDLRPVRPRQRPRGGLSAKFYVVVLIAAVMLIALQAIPLLHGRGSANADATQAQQDDPAAAAPTEPASEQTTPDQPAPKSAQPAALEPQAKIEPVAPSQSPAADTPTTTISPLSAAKPEPTSPPAPSGDTAAAAATTATTPDSTPPGIGVTLSVQKDEAASADSIKEPSAAESAPSSVTTNETFAFFSSVRPANLTPKEPTNPEITQAKPATKQPEPDMWRGVLRLLSAVTKINFTAPPAASEATLPLAEAATPIAIPEDVNESTPESSPSDFEPTPLSSVETLPAASQPVNPADDESRLVIENPRETGGMVRFLVDGNVASLRPGESLTLRAGATRIQFHRGDDFENVDVEISHGTYQFSPTKTGWTLSR
jgi:hypothetical protein